MSLPGQCQDDLPGACHQTPDVESEINSINAIWRYFFPQCEYTINIENLRVEGDKWSRIKNLGIYIYSSEKNTTSAGRVNLDLESFRQMHPEDMDFSLPVNKTWSFSETDVYNQSFYFGMVVREIAYYSPVNDEKKFHIHRDQFTSSGDPLHDIATMRFSVSPIQGDLVVRRNCGKPVGE